LGEDRLLGDLLLRGLRQSTVVADDIVELSRPVVEEWGSLRGREVSGGSLRGQKSPGSEVSGVRSLRGQKSPGSERHFGQIREVYNLVINFQRYSL
jgi:hypothetical protein